MILLAVPLSFDACPYGVPGPQNSFSSHPWHRYFHYFSCSPKVVVFLYRSSQFPIQAFHRFWILTSISMAPTQRKSTFLKKKKKSCLRLSVCFEFRSWCQSEKMNPAYLHCRSLLWVTVPWVYPVLLSTTLPKWIDPFQCFILLCNLCTEDLVLCTLLFA